MPADLLTDLRRLREVQVAQAAAAREYDAAALDALHLERARITGRLVPFERSGLGPADLAEARALVELIRLDQERMIGEARIERDRLGAEMATLGHGKSAVVGYKPTPRTSALHVDFSG